MSVSHNRFDTPVAVENPGGDSDVLIVCEHASNHFPEEFGTLGLSEADRRAHIAWDSGALGIARGLSARLNATLVRATVSRLIYDLNRPPDATGAMPTKSEIFDIPGNASVDDAERLRRTQAIYLPFHARLHAEIAARIAAGRPPVIVTIHSFTPVYFGKARAVEFGVIHDADPALALATVEAARALTDLRVELNEPYSAADQVTHTLRLQATPYGLRNVMLEIRNDLIATPGAEEAMADKLVPVLRRAMGELQRGRHRSA
ncbi:N-formylglutamate amidohydrolase [Frigidibacter sp. RF13]|uniref:N-formylglutamate amidohydrolase n=1 Tax=Frigidibacter sp. RF13 TaxID=2997340 RepID=UPI002270458B|nr:N-formylglutamate amidohydrolase [Frigidibacter sp. RF13]MCY1127414.1 N-formylglutamate amidohydrolase [Frigidibacter sp. RF13]